MEPWESPVRCRLRESLPVRCTITTRSLDWQRAATDGFHFLWLAPKTRLSRRKGTLTAMIC